MNKILKKQLNVINALVYRDYRIRFNASKFSFVGTLVTPVGLIVIFLLIYTFVRTRSNPYMDTSLFLTIGIIQYGLFFDLSFKSSNLMQTYASFFIHKVIRPLDILISKTLVTLALQTIVLILILQSIFFIKGEIIMQDLPLLAISYLSLTLFSFGLGMILMILGYKNKFLSLKIIPIFNRPIFILSGTIFSIFNVPAKFQKFFTWNPVLQANEISRHALTDNYPLVDGVSLIYLISVSFIVFLVRIICYFNNYKLLKSNDVYI